MVSHRRTPDTTIIGHPDTSACVQHVPLRTCFRESRIIRADPSLDGHYRRQQDRLAYQLYQVQYTYYTPPRKSKNENDLI